MKVIEQNVNAQICRRLRGGVGVPQISEVTKLGSQKMLNEASLGLRIF